MGKSSIQSLGTGHNFQFTSFDVMLSIEFSGSGGTIPRIALVECPTSIFGSGCINVVSKDFPYVVSQGKTLYTINTDPYILNPAKYYFISIQCAAFCWGGTSTNSKIIVHGLSTDTYPGGAFYYANTDTGKDIYFAFHSALPQACSVTTTPSTKTIPIGGTATISANVTSGLGTATVTAMHFGSYNTDKATVSPSEDPDSPFETTVTALAEGNTAIWASQPSPKETPLSGHSQISPTAAPASQAGIPIRI